MRRARLLGILNIIFLVGGLACLAYGLRVSEVLLENRENAFIGGVLIFLAESLAFSSPRSSGTTRACWVPR